MTDPSRGCDADALDAGRSHRVVAPRRLRRAEGRRVVRPAGLLPRVDADADLQPGRLEHPELKAIGKDGNPVSAFGIGCWGYNLCPSKPESQRFLLEYVREMSFEFYPNADGLMIESSDYAICHCKACGEHFFEKEFE